MPFNHNRLERCGFLLNVGGVMRHGFANAVARMGHRKASEKTN
jgi:hypothetical protein